jgi:hypothetical protein
MLKHRVLAGVLLAVSCLFVVTACGDDDEGESTPALGTCDRRVGNDSCIELHDASGIDMSNQEEVCLDANGNWSNDPCPTEELVGCCEYTFGNQFRECFYAGAVADHVAYCMTWDDGVWTPAD